MIKTIVVPLDGSEASERALGPAGFLAAELDAPVHLITTTFAADAEDAKQLLERGAQTLVASGIDADTEVIVHRFATRGILDVLDASPEPVLCMATHGRGAAGTLLLGSTADEVLREAHHPIVLVGPHSAGVHRTARRLIFCWDRSRLSASIEPTVRDWAAALGLEVWIVHVRTPHDLHHDASASELHDDLNVLAAELRDAGTEVHTKVLDAADPAEAIVDFASETATTLIALSTHGEGRLTDTALGRVGTKIVRHSPCPVLVERPSA
jgi:nucleotide-binding universal stress UspA family protein